MTADIKVITRAGFDKKDLLETVDNLRQAIVDGEVACFIAAAIGPNDSTTMWLGNTTKTALQVLGAIENLKLGFYEGKIK